jgi:hypothetical protein
LKLRRTWAEKRRIETVARQRRTAAGGSGPRPIRGAGSVQKGWDLILGSRDRTHDLQGWNKGTNQLSYRLDVITVGSRGYIGCRRSCLLTELNLGAVTACGMLETRTRGQRTPGSGDAARTGTHEVELWLLPEAGKQKKGDDLVSVRRRSCAGDEHLQRNAAVNGRAEN